MDMGLQSQFVSLCFLNGTMDHLWLATLTSVVSAQRPVNDVFLSMRMQLSSAGKQVLQLAEPPPSPFQRPRCWFVNGPKMLLEPIRLVYRTAGLEGVFLISWNWRALIGRRSNMEEFRDAYSDGRNRHCVSGQ